MDNGCLCGNLYHFHSEMALYTNLWKKKSEQYVSFFSGIILLNLLKTIINEIRLMGLSEVNCETLPRKSIDDNKIG